MKIRLTLHGGEIHHYDVGKVEYLPTCPYCDIQFITEDPRKKFCMETHKVMYSQKGIGRTRVIIATTTRIH